MLNNYIDITVKGQFRLQILEITLGGLAVKRSNKERGEHHRDGAAHHGRGRMPGLEYDTDANKKAGGNGHGHGIVDDRKDKVAIDGRHCSAGQVDGGTDVQ